jgi:subtilisin family serine protease
MSNQPKISLKAGFFNRCRLLMLLTGSLLAFKLSAQQQGYFIRFTNKTWTTGQLSKPYEYLSEKALLRRVKQGIKIDSTDLPVSTLYLAKLKEYPLKIAFTSKWMNGAIVFSNDNEAISSLKALPFIQSVDLVKGTMPLLQSKFQPIVSDTDYLKSVKQNSVYGDASSQIETVNGHFLHEAGFKGAGMLIAVIDAGFYKTNELPLTSHLMNGQIVGTFDFVNPTNAPDKIFDQHTHGMEVLSIMGGYSDGTYCGTAPQASFWLMRTENTFSEYPIEADYWICAAEKADSAGVDIINSSLGYSTYDNTDLNLTYSHLNGSSRISRAANMAVEKGMVVVNSAGNEGNKSWLHVLTPADASKILTVGAMRADSVVTSFSSVGPTADNRIKPDIVAMGYECAIQGVDISITKGSGTSYSAPVISGLVACLWQARPNLKAGEIIQLVKESANHYTLPDNSSGYGIPNFRMAYQKSNSTEMTGDDHWSIETNPVKDYLYARNSNLSSTAKWTVTVYDSQGQTKIRNTIDNPFYYIDLDAAHIIRGLYFIRFESATTCQTIKFIKR